MWNSIKTEKSFSCFLSFSPFLNLSLWCILYASFLSSFLFSQIISIYPSTFSLSSDRITHSPTWEKVRDFRYQGLNCKNSERGLSHVVISISCYFWWWWWWCFQSWMSWIWISAPKRNSYLTLSTSISRFNQFQFSSIAQSCLTLCNPINHGMPGLPVHYQLPEFTQTHVHRVGDAIQPSHPLSSPFPPAPNPSQHQGLFQWVTSSHQVAKVLELQLQHQSFQWIFRTDFL